MFRNMDTDIYIDPANQPYNPFNGVFYTAPRRMSTRRMRPSSSSGIGGGGITSAPPKPVKPVTKNVTTKVGASFNISAPAGYIIKDYDKSLVRITSGISGRYSAPQFGRQVGGPKPKHRGTAPAMPLNTFVTAIKAGKTTMTLYNKIQNSQILYKITINPVITKKSMTANIGVQFKQAIPAGARVPVPYADGYLSQVFIGRGTFAATPIKSGTLKVTFVSPSGNKLVYTINIPRAPPPPRPPPVIKPPINQPPPTPPPTKQTSVKMTVTNGVKFTITPPKGYTMSAFTSSHPYYSFFNAVVHAAGTPAPYIPKKVGNAKLQASDKSGNSVVYLINIQAGTTPATPQPATPQPPTPTNTITINGTVYTIISGPIMKNSNKIYTLTYKGRKFIAVYYKATGKWTVTDQGAAYYSSGLTVPKTMSGMLLAIGAIGTAYFVVKKVRD